MKKRPGWFAADPLVWVATALLGMVAVWSLSLSLLFPAPAAPSMFTPAQERENRQGQMVLLASSGDEARAKPVAAASTGLPRLPLRVISLRPDEGPGLRGRQPNQRLWSLLHSYGYDELPVLLVLDGQGRVVRVSEF